MGKSHKKGWKTRNLKRHQKKKKASEKISKAKRKMTRNEVEKSIEDKSS